MQTNISESHPSQTRLRAVVEILDGEIKIFPVADSDADEKIILHALRFFLTRGS